MRHCDFATSVSGAKMIALMVDHLGGQVRARDYHSNWMTAVACLDEDCYLGAENSYNLFTARKNSDSAADDERNRLEVPSAAYSWILTCEPFQKLLNRCHGAMSLCDTACWQSRRPGAHLSVRVSWEDRLPGP